MGPRGSRRQNLPRTVKRVDLMHAMMTNYLTAVFPLCLHFSLAASTDVSACPDWGKCAQKNETKAHLAVKCRTSFLRVHKSDVLLRWAAAAPGFLSSSHLKLEPEPLALGCWSWEKFQLQGCCMWNARATCSSPWNRLDKVRAVIFNWFHSHFTHEGKWWWNQLVTRRKSGAMLARRVNILCKGMLNEVISAVW